MITSRQAWVVLGVFVLVLGAGLYVLAATSPPFFAIGRPTGSNEAVVYKVVMGSWQILASRSLGKPSGDGRFSSDGRQLYILAFDDFTGDTVLALNPIDLSVQWKYQVKDEVGLSEHATVMIALSRIFVHPVTERIYLTNDLTGLPDKVYVLEPRNRALERILTGPSGAFTFDQTRNRLYVGGGSGIQARIWMIDLKTSQVVPLWHLPPVGDLIALPKSQHLLLIIDAGSDYELARYDPARESVVRKSGRLGVRVLRGPAVSLDGRRLFAATSPYNDPGSGVIIDVHALSIINRLKLPAPVAHFVPAPDGRGMWMVEDSGKVYRLDDQTGQMLEQVPLPFRLSTLITPP